MVEHYSAVERSTRGKSYIARNLASNNRPLLAESGCVHASHVGCPVLGMTWLGMTSHHITSHKPSHVVSRLVRSGGGLGLVRALCVWTLLCHRQRGAAWDASGAVPLLSDVMGAAQRWVRWQELHVRLVAAHVCGSALT